VHARWRRFDDAQVASAARILRGFHDAAAGCALASGGEVVCHGDPGPNNVVFQEARPVAFIDFEFAAPGARLEDVAYLAWSWCISSRPDRGGLPQQGRQVRALCDAYGLCARSRACLIDAVIARQARNAGWWRARGGPGIAEWSERERAFTERFRAEFLSALG
jgi:Ser/Thr protein kinase RdoA (MazF antagonist)